MIKQSVLNTFKRIGINPEIATLTGMTTSRNRFTGESVPTTYFVQLLIGWVYAISDEYEQGNHRVNVSDFDRLRYFVLEQVYR